MAFTYDLTTDIGKMRMMIPDRVTPDHIFEDAEITALLVIEGNVIKLGVALALETIASDTAMVLKVIRLLDLTTDGAKVSDALLARAKLLRAQAATEDVEGAFDWAEMVLNDFSYREFLLKDALRG